MLKLFQRLYIDKTFQLLVVPSETIIWSQVHNLEDRGPELLSKIENGELIYPFKTTKSHISRAFVRLKEFCEEYLIKQNGAMRLDNQDQIQMCKAVLEVILFMVSHGFYSDQAALNRIARPIINILDGSNDTMRVNGRDVLLGVRRYFPDPFFELCVVTKCLACDVLL